MLNVCEAIELLNEQLNVLKRHIYVKRVQVKSYNDIKENLKVNELLLLVEFSENNKNKQQNEIQSAYFGQTCFSIFTACCYLKSPEGDLVKDSVTIVTESADHSRATAFSCVSKVVSFV